MNKFKQIIRKIANNKGISEDEVYREMQAAIDAGYNNSDPNVQAEWKKITASNKRPSPEDLITYIVKKMNN